MNEVKTLVEFTAQYKGFPVVFSMQPGCAEQLLAILKSFPMGTLQRIERCHGWQVEQPHLYFHITHEFRMTREYLDKEAALLAQNRKNCLSAAGIALTLNLFGSVCSHLWLFSHAGLRFKGLTPETADKAIKLLEEYFKKKIEFTAYDPQQTLLEQEWERTSSRLSV